MDLIQQAKSINTERDQREFLETIAAEVEDLKKKAIKQNKPKQDKMIRGTVNK